MRCQPQGLLPLRTISGLGLVSDEFTVPLCAIHHQQNHATGNERIWWQEHKIDPLAVAARLWRESQHLPAPDHVSPRRERP